MSRLSPVLAVRIDFTMYYLFNLEIQEEGRALLDENGNVLGVIVAMLDTLPEISNTHKDML